jgi:formate hydrogenlyase subunit 3/multisubunit Na+/H+ antiporter MnhD subunit
MGLDNISRFIRRKRKIIGRKDSRVSGESNSSSSPNSKGKWIIVLGIVIAVIGFAGAIYYGSQVVKEEVSAGAKSPSTTPSQIKNVLPSMDFEIVFVVIAVIGFGILTYGLVGRVDKPLDFYPK